MSKNSNEIADGMVGGCCGIVATGLLIIIVIIIIIAIF